MGNLTMLLKMIQPPGYVAQAGERKRHGHHGVHRKATRIHVRRSVEGFVERSTVLREMIEGGQAGLIGAVYDVETVTVEFLEDTFMLDEVKHFYLDVASAQRAAG